ncbi:hypothetical protein THIOSC15_1610006 [uncultured Thiomicrorhabdus sp.]
MIIDEQHRFGVHQRLTLQQKGQNIVLEGNDESEADKSSNDEFLSRLRRMKYP